MAVSIRWNALEENRLLHAVNGPTGRWLATIAAKVETAAKGYTPVDTGRLRSSITWTIIEDGRSLVAIIGTNVEYAIYVHEGTRFMEGTPFLVDGLLTATGSTGGYRY